MVIDRLYQLQRLAIQVQQEQPHNMGVLDIRICIDRLVRDAEREAALANPVTARHQRVPHRQGRTIDASVEYPEPTERRIEGTCDEAHTTVPDSD